MSQRFIDLLWPEDPPGHLLVWTLPDKRSYWTASKEEAHRYAIKAGAERDVYIEVACGPDPATLGRPAESARIKSEEVVALPGFFADLDCSTHPSKVHFDSKEHGLRFIGRLPLKPTVIVDSGGGLHAWWLFREPWVFESNEERRRAERLEYGWTNYLRRLALEDGVRDGVDHVKDLARVLRYPGTLNRKYRGDPRRVEIITGDGARWNEGDFEPWESEVAGHRVSAADLAKLDLRLTAESEPPFSKLRMLMDLDPKFRATWERRRQLPKDQSVSGFDMSLATQMALIGWSADEIAATLVAWRREHSLPLKLREQYYSHTIAKAFANRDQYEAERSVESGEVAPGGDEQLRDMIAGVTGVAVTSIVVHGEAESGRYVAVIGDKHVKVGGLRDLLRWDTWQGVAFAHGKIQGRPKAQRWDIVLRAMQRIVEARPAEDADEGRIFEAWVAEHLRAQARLTVTDERGREFASNVLRQQAPYRMNGNVYVCLESLRRMLKFEHERVTQADLVRMFRQSGWRAVRKQARDDKGLAQCRYWESPEVEPVDLDNAADHG